MLTHEDLVAHFERNNISVNYEAGQGSIWCTSLQYYAASDINRGVEFWWVACDDGCGYLPGCRHSPHVHVSTRIRKSAGNPLPPNITGDFVPKDIKDIDDLRGAPPTRSNVTKEQMPEPYSFRQEYAYHYGGLHTHRYVIATAHLFGAVGITKDGKVDSDVAAIPGELVWWHFDCQNSNGAAFSIITNDDVWYPVNRRNNHITTHLRPKKSLDLSQLSVTDQRFLQHIISDFVSGL